MKKMIIYIFLSFCFLTSESQTIISLDIVVTYDNNMPVKDRIAYLYDGEKKIYGTFSDECGVLSFFIDTIPPKPDSIYFYIVETKEINKIYLKELDLFSNNKIAGYIITVKEFKRWKETELQKYIKDNNLMPRRQKRLAKDVH